jgi:hypothetical protein
VTIGNKKVKIKEGRTRYVPAPLFHRRIVIVTNPWHIMLLSVSVIAGLAISYARVIDMVALACTIGSLFFVFYCRKQVDKLRSEVRHAISGTLVNLDGDTIDITEIGADEGRFTDDAPADIISISKHDEKA